MGAETAFACVAPLLLICGTYADPIVFSSDRTIVDGDVYDYIQVRDTPPDHTHVEMTGGEVFILNTYDASVLTASGGDITSLAALDESTVDTSGGVRIPQPVFIGQSTLNMYGGDLGALRFEMWENSTANILGGIVHNLAAIDEATVNLRGGSITSAGSLLTAQDSSTVNVFGYGFQYDPLGVPGEDHPVLTGYWLDGTPFAIRLLDTETYDHINLLPEPATGFLSLLLLTAGTLRRRRVTQ